MEERERRYFPVAAMMTADRLKGVFVAVPLPWDAHGRFDEAAFRRDVARLCAAGIHGIYTTGSTGEFYALDFDEFTRVVDAFAEETKSFSVLTQVGCTAVHNAEAMKRARYVSQKGIDAIQIALPFWTPLSDREVVGFFKDIRDSSDRLPIVHYNTSRSKRVLAARDYVMLAGEIPELVGTKLVGEFSAIIEVLIGVPQLAHFVGEALLVPAMMLGAKGTYSSIALMHPQPIQALYEACERGEWSAAVCQQRRITTFVVEALAPLVREGYSDAAIDKAMAAVAGFLECSTSVRKPYRELSPVEIEALRSHLERVAPEFIECVRNSPGRSSATVETLSRRRDHEALGT